MATISVQNLEKSFQVKVAEGGRLKGLFKPQFQEVKAVKGISFGVERGEMVAFIGPNGAGKSTTIKMLTGILYPTSGTAHVLGKVPWLERQRLAMSIGSVFGQKS
ncbi:MAG: ATP-binding cassette domain-containing protein, partial [bacterium]|nr:ATP-binding cassette domain-containing protein [bacterium]